jgi:hypothetical protein
MYSVYGVVYGEKGCLHGGSTSNCVGQRRSGIEQGALVTGGLRTLLQQIPGRSPPARTKALLEAEGSREHTMVFLTPFSHLAPVCWAPIVTVCGRQQSGVDRRMRRSSQSSVRYGAEALCQTAHR